MFRNKKKLKNKKVIDKLNTSLSQYKHDIDVLIRKNNVLTYDNNQYRNKYNRISANYNDLFDRYKVLDGQKIQSDNYFKTALECNRLSSLEYNGKINYLEKEVLRLRQYFDKKKQRYEKNNECCLCKENKSTIAIVPCGHVCYCTECNANYDLASMKCPICRVKVERLIKVYLV